MIDKNCNPLDDELQTHKKTINKDPITNEVAAPSRQLPELTQLLRWGGGVLLISAVLTFMYQGIYSFTPITRHWIMLAICAVLGLFGVTTGSGLKDDKGARVFFAFSAFTFPVLASQIGAMLFSLFGKAPLGMPQPLIFSFQNSAMVFGITIMTLAVVIPLSYLAFRILARSQANWLTGVFTIANLFILIPVREGILAGAIIITAMLGIYLIDNTRLRNDYRLENFEGRVARAMMFSPILVMFGRTHFYHMDPIFNGLIVILAGAFFAFDWGRSLEKNRLRTLSQLSGLAGMTSGWLIFLSPTIKTFLSGEVMAAYLILLPIAVAIGLLSLINNGQVAIFYRILAALIALLSVLITFAIGATPLDSIAGIAIALMILSVGTLMGEKAVFAIGSITALLSLGNFGYQVVRVNSGYAWLVLAIIGIGVMLSASLAEKKHYRNFLKYSHLWGRYKINQLS